MLINPLAPAVEGWLVFFNALPLPFRAFLSLSFAFMLVSFLVSIAWRIK